MLVLANVAFAQEEIAPQESAARPSPSTVEGYSFDECTVIGTGIDIEFLDVDKNKIDHAQIVRWESAFEPNPNPGPNSPSHTLKDDFKDFDPERFFLEVKDPFAGTSTITVKLESFKSGADPSSDEPLDEAIGVVLTDIGGNIYRSGACLLVADNDEIDDNFSNPVTSNAGLDGMDDTGNDPTIYAEIEGQLKLTYNNDHKLIDVCDKTPKEVRSVKLNIISMLGNDNMTPYHKKSEILAEINNAQKIWGQCCFKFVNTEGEAFSEADIIEMPQPPLIDLDTGLKSNLSKALMPTTDLFLDEKTLLDLVKDEDESTVDIVFLSKLLRYNTTTMLWGNPNIPIVGLAINELAVSSTLMEEKYRNTLYIMNGGTYFTFAHELGHILTNFGHYGTTAMDDYYYSEFELPGHLNLLRSGGTSTTNGVGKSKRLVKRQCSDAQIATNLPFIQN